MQRLMTKELRLAARYRPAGAVTVTDKATGTVAYLWTNLKGQPCAITYIGTAAKPHTHLRYSNEARRAQHVQEIFAAVAANAARKTERRAEQCKPHSLQVGHILVTCWGYEQTNREWYEVTKIISPRMVAIREIRGHSVTSDPGYSSMSDHVIPMPGEYIGEPERRRANSSNSVTFASYRSATLWDGKPCYRSWYG